MYQEVSEKLQTLDSRGSLKIFKQESEAIHLLKIGKMDQNRVRLLVKELMEGLLLKSSPKTIENDFLVHMWDT